MPSLLEHFATSESIFDIIKDRDISVTTSLFTLFFSSLQSFCCNMPVTTDMYYLPFLKF